MINRNFLSLSLVVIVTWGFFSCSNDPDPQVLEASFTRFYDMGEFNASLKPMDIKQTPDGGYLVLAQRKLYDDSGNKIQPEYPGVYILKADKTGAFITDENLDPNYVHPVGPWLKHSDHYYFFCMDRDLQTTYMVRVDSTVTDITYTQLNMLSPLASNKDLGGDFLLLTYDNGDRKSLVHRIDPETGSAIGSPASVTIGEGDNDALDERITNHFLSNRRQYPFLVGQTASGNYYFNGFENYTFSFAFITFSAPSGEDALTGALRGNQDDAGVAAAYNISGNNFALSWFNYEQNYILPTTGLSPSGSPQVTGLSGQSFELKEMIPFANVKVKGITIKEQDYRVYGTDTNSRQIGLFFYSASNELVGAKNLGFSNPFEFGNIIATSDGGIAVVGITYIAGRFPRIAIIKLSKAEVEAIIS